MKTNFFSKTILLLVLCSMRCLNLNAEEPPSFSLAWSEYPSWSAFGVAHKYGIINGQKGKLGPIEKKWNVDMILIEADYDPCITMYGSGQCDAVCITNMDVLNPSISRKSVAILPTSTSYGADACIVVDTIATVKDLKGKKVYGLAKTVSEYCFVRNIEIQKESEKDFSFTNMDPGAAALAMQQKQKGYDAIMVWNPFVLETLNKRKDVKVLFDSTTIPGEIIDMVVMSQSSLEKPGGEDFACAVIDTFYAINKKMADPKTSDETLVSLGEKFSNLNLESMKTVVKQTKFFGTSNEGIQALVGDKMRQEIMPRVVDFCVSHEIVPQKPAIGFGDKTMAPDVNLLFDSGYINRFMEIGPEKEQALAPKKATPTPSRKSQNK
jgi:NitT/TauT family transport system substrate-binding protein